MNKLIVVFLAAVFLFSSVSARGQDASTGQTPREKDKAKAVKEAIQGNTPPAQRAKDVRDLPPYYGGMTFDQWRKELKLRSEREYERLEKLTPKEQDDEHAKRKRRQEEWQKMNVPAKEPAKQ